MECPWFRFPTHVGLVGARFGKIDGAEKIVERHRLLIVLGLKNRATPANVVVTSK